MGGITNARVDSAASPSKLKELLERVALVTRPAGGGATVLFALGRITSSSRWLDGDSFCVEITGNDVESKLEIWSERDEVRERIVEPTTFPVPVDELIALLESDPTLVGSLRIAIAPRKVSLAPRQSGVHERLRPDDR